MSVLCAFVKRGPGGSVFTLDQPLAGQGVLVRSARSRSIAALPRWPSRSQSDVDQPADPYAAAGPTEPLTSTASSLAAGDRIACKVVRKFAGWAGPLGSASSVCNWRTAGGSCAQLRDLEGRWIMASHESECTCTECGVKITGVPVVPAAPEGPSQAQIEKLKPTVYLCVECAREQGFSFTDAVSGIRSSTSDTAS